MEDDEDVSMFEDDFISDSTQKATNDPWSTQQNDTPQYPHLNPVPVNPLRDFITPEKYIESLEKRMNKLKGKQKGKVTAKDMIASLQQAKEIQFEHVMEERTIDLFCDEDTNSESVMSSLQRKINPDKQAINSQELLPLVKEDVLAQVSEQADTLENQMKTGR